MSVLIKGMEMPRKCIRCPVNVYGRCLVNDDKDVSKATADAVRDKDCPLVPIPEHGDLIDRDKIAYFKDDSNLVDFDYAYRSQINSMSTIIPADEPKEEC